MKRIKGRDVALYTEVGGQLLEVALSKSCNLNVTSDIAEFSSLLSGRGKRKRAGRYEWVVDCSSLVASDDVNPGAFLRAIIEGSRFAVVMSLDSGGNLNLARGYCYAQSYVLNSDVDGAASYDVVLVGDGAIELE